MRQKTEQELFWEGSFGTEYTERNKILPKQRQPFFEEILQKTCGVRSICELGANRGHNLQAINYINSNIKLTGVELNKSAFTELNKIPGIEAVHSSIQDFKPSKIFDFVFTSGVLIHINPDELLDIYQKMYEISSRYILLNEYYSPVPVKINYRGYTQKLFKRDFANDLIEYYKDKVSVIDYGFLWNKVHPEWDNTTWFLIEKVI